MAATLAHIKSKELLPAPPPGQEDDPLDEGGDPRQELIRRLLEYQKYKLAGEQLSSRGIEGRDVFLRGAEVDTTARSAVPSLAQVPLYALVEAFQAVLARAKMRLPQEVIADRISLADRIQELCDVLRARRRVTFDALFEGLTTKFDLVITFLALLEMTRLHMTRLAQTQALGPIYVEATLDDAGPVDLQPLDEDRSK